LQETGEVRIYSRFDGNAILRGRYFEPGEGGREIPELPSDRQEFIFISLKLLLQYVFVAANNHHLLFLFTTVSATYPPTKQTACRPKFGINESDPRTLHEDQLKVIS
jgi:hypothetical protein